MHVRFVVGGSEHDHGNLSELGIFFYLLKYFAAIFLGQIQIEQNQIGIGSAFELSFAPQKLQGDYAVLRQVNIMQQPPVAESLFD